MRCSDSENKSCMVDSMKNRQMIEDDLIKENSVREAFAGAFLSADKRSGIAFVKASGRQKSCIAFNDRERRWRTVGLDPKGPGKIEICYN